MKQVSALSLGPPKSDRDKVAALWPHSIRYGREIGVMMLIYIIALAYAATSPIILPFALIYFIFSWIMWRYNILYVSERCFESGGQIWDTVFKQVCCCMFIFEFFTGNPSCCAHSLRCLPINVCMRVHSQRTLCYTSLSICNPAVHGGFYVCFLSPVCLSMCDYSCARTVFDLLIAQGLAASCCIASTRLETSIKYCAVLPFGQQTVLYHVLQAERCQGAHHKFISVTQGTKHVCVPVQRLELLALIDVILSGYDTCLCLCSMRAVCKLSLCPGQHPGCFNDPHHLQVLQVASQYMCLLHWPVTL